LSQVAICQLDTLNKLNRVSDSSTGVGGELLTVCKMLRS